LNKVTSILLSLFLFAALGLTIVHGADGVRDCLYVPGVSVPAQMPDDLMNAPTPTTFPTATPPPVTTVDAETTARQLEVYTGLWNAVNDHYVYPDFRGRDWNAVGAEYEALIRQGLSNDDFYAAMQAMLAELGDQHSYFQSHVQVTQEEEALARGQDFVGIGMLAMPIQGADRAAIIVVFPDGPAAEAGLLPHDTILKVDGGPIRDETGRSRTRGPEDSQVTLTVQRPGELPRDVTITAAGDSALRLITVRSPHASAVLLPTLLDKPSTTKVRSADDGGRWIA
jgi:C-terminal processing protease CtpA/Prc